MDLVLRDGVTRFPNVDVRLEHACLSLTQNADHIKLTVLAAGNDRVQRVTASYVFAADGASSPIRAQLGVDAHWGVGKRYRCGPVRLSRVPLPRGRELAALAVTSHRVGG